MRAKCLAQEYSAVPPARAQNPRIRGANNYIPAFSAPTRVSKDFHKMPRRHHIESIILLTLRFYLFFLPFSVVSRVLPLCRPCFEMSIWRWQIKTSGVYSDKWSMLSHKSHENWSGRRVGSRLYEWRRLWYKNESLLKQRWLQSYLLRERSVQQWSQRQRYRKQRMGTDLSARCYYLWNSSPGAREFVTKVFQGGSRKYQLA